MGIPDNPVRKRRGISSTPQLIDAVRRCAAMKLSTAETANSLTTKEHPLTRNGIVFEPKSRTAWGPKRKQTAVQPRPAPYKPPPQQMDSFIVVKTARPSVRQTVRCSWKRCDTDAEPGDMFCFSHGRKALF